MWSISNWVKSCLGWTPLMKTNLVKVVTATRIFFSPFHRRFFPPCTFVRSNLKQNGKGRLRLHFHDNLIALCWWMEGQQIENKREIKDVTSSYTNLIWNSSVFDAMPYIRNMMSREANFFSPEAKSTVARPAAQKIRSLFSTEECD